MRRGRIIRAIAGIAFLAGALAAETIDGNILITHRLTRRNVTPAITAYQRGTPVELADTDEQNELDYERSHVAIWIEGDGVPQTRPTRAPRASIEQTGRRFAPDMVVAPAGSAISFPNLDAIFHNVFSLSKPKAFDLGNYPKGDARTVVFPRPGIVYVGCHLHPNMTAVIVITPGELCATASRDGKFTIEGVPPGAWTVVAWHRVAGFYRQKVEVLPGRGAHAEFLIPVRPQSPVPRAVEGS
jgi:plastocyanin